MDVDLTADLTVEPEVSNSILASSSRPVLVSIQSLQCMHCDIFLKQHWEVIYKGVMTSSGPRVQTVVCTTRNANSYDHTSYPTGLEFWCWIWPSLILVPGDLWDRACKDPTVTLLVEDGVVPLNRVVQNDRAMPVRGYNLDGPGVLSWVRKTLTLPQFGGNGVDPNITSLT